MTLFEETRVEIGGVRGKDALESYLPITLDQLIERAGLLTRVDRKYLLPTSQLDVVLGELRDRAQVLDIDGRRDFSYDSVYFDTPDLTTYWLAARGRRRRFKLRTRTYVDSAQGFLEVKTRGSRGCTVKHRIPYDPADARRLTPEGREFVGAVLADSGIAFVDTSTLAPVLTSRYMRATLFIPASESRATIDTRLSWQLESGTSIDRPGMAMIETKSGSRASEVDRVLWTQGHRPARVSKFATGMAALDPELVANRWGRVLHREFERTNSGRSAGSAPRASTGGPRLTP